MNEKDIYQMQMTYKSVLIEIYDTDVIVIAMSYFELMSLIDGDLNMEVKFGTDILYDLKDCWAVFSKLQLQGLRFLFAFSGSDVTASFYMKKKLSIFKEEDISAVQTFVLKLYCCEASSSSLADARCTYFKS